MVTLTLRRAADAARTERRGLWYRREPARAHLGRIGRYLTRRWDAARRVRLRRGWIECRECEGLIFGGWSHGWGRKVGEMRIGVSCFVGGTGERVVVIPDLVRVWWRVRSMMRGYLILKFVILSNECYEAYLSWNWYVYFVYVSLISEIDSRERRNFLGRFERYSTQRRARTLNKYKWLNWRSAKRKDFPRETLLMSVILCYCMGMLQIFHNLHWRREIDSSSSFAIKRPIILGIMLRTIDHRVSDTLIVFIIYWSLTLLCVFFG